MMILDPTTAACFAAVDGHDLLDFQLDGEEDGGLCDSSSSLDSLTTEATPFVRNSEEFVEEELEWLSNKDAFPTVDTCFGILADNPQLITNHQSPVSVLENSSSNSNGSGVTVASFRGGTFEIPRYPVRPRSRRQRLARKPAGLGKFPWMGQVNVKNKRESSVSMPRLPKVVANGGEMGRRCLHCQADKTPQWRAGPMGPKTLCNACGVRYKSGRLLPEYRPANSPTFSSALHSNSHRKVVEMRRQKGQVEEQRLYEGCGYRVESGRAG